MKRDELLKALSFVLPGVNDKIGDLEGCDTFVFDDVWIKTYNNRLSIGVPFNSGIHAAVNAVEFFKVLSKMKGDEVTFELAGNVLTTKCGTAVHKTGLVESLVDKYVDNLNLDSLGWTPIPKEFFNGMKECLFSAATDSVHGPLCGVLVCGNLIVSCDNFRASKITMQDTVGDFLIPAETVTDLLKIPGLTEYSISDAWVHFESGQEEVPFVVSIRRMVDIYPKEKVLSLLSDANIGDLEYTFPEGLASLVDRIAVLSYSSTDGNIPFVIVEKIGDELVCTGERGSSSFEDRIKLPKGLKFPKKFKIKVNPEFLKVILGRDASFGITSTVMFFSSANFKHLLSLVV